MCFTIILQLEVGFHYPEPPSRAHVVRQEDSDYCGTQYGPASGDISDVLRRLYLQRNSRYKQYSINHPSPSLYSRAFHCCISRAQICKLGSLTPSTAACVRTWSFIGKNSTRTTSIIILLQTTTNLYTKRTARQRTPAPTIKKGTPPCTVCWPHRMHVLGLCVGIIWIFLTYRPLNHGCESFGQAMCLRV